MSNDTDEDNTARMIDGGDAVDIDVADDPENSRTIVTGMTVSAEEKVSTGDYESYTPYASRRITFRPAIDVSTPAGRVRVRREALKTHRDLQNDLQAAIDARLSVDGPESWPNGVTPADLDADPGRSNPRGDGR